jgi:hypothetical protein
MSSISLVPVSSATSGWWSAFHFPTALHLSEP